MLSVLGAQLFPIEVPTLVASGNGTLAVIEVTLGGSSVLYLFRLWAWGQSREKMTSSPVTSAIIGLTGVFQFSFPNLFLRGSVSLPHQKQYFWEAGTS